MITTTRHHRTPFAFTLGRRQALRLWEQAVRCAAVVTLTPRTDEELQLVGPIESDTGESIWIGLGEFESARAAPLRSVCCDGVLELGDDRYLFETNVLAVRDEDGRTSLEMARPEGLQVIQRRRFVRAELRDSGRVQLSRADPDEPAAAKGWSASASIMNISVDGLACRAHRADADAIAVGDVVRTTFAVVRGQEPFVLDAVIKSKIPAGTEGHTVLGLHLLHADRRQQKRLQAALEGHTCTAGSSQR